MIFTTYLKKHQKIKSFSTIMEIISEITYVEDFVKFLRDLLKLTKLMITLNLLL